jgi:hypothetical protein
VVQKIVARGHRRKQCAESAGVPLGIADFARSVSGTHGADLQSKSKEESNKNPKNEVSAHAWVTPGELSGYEFPEADDAIVARLQHE